MSKFATFSMILDTRIEPNMDEHSGADEGLPFLQWKVGTKVQSNGSDSTIWKIAKMTSNGEDGPEVSAMTYFLTVILVSIEDPTVTKTLKSSTLQTGYSVVQQGEDDGVDEASAPAIPTKPLTIAVDSIGRFYPRKGDKPGTRIILKSGTAYVVLEDHAKVLEIVSA